MQPYILLWLKQSASATSASDSVARLRVCGDATKTGGSVDTRNFLLGLNTMPATTLDLKGMRCPLPVLRANKVLRQLNPGDQLEILATDRAAARDFDNFCLATGHSLVASEESDGVLTIVIRKAR